VVGANGQQPPPPTHLLAPRRVPSRRGRVGVVGGPSTERRPRPSFLASGNLSAHWRSRASSSSTDTTVDTFALVHERLSAASGGRDVLTSEVTRPSAAKCGHHPPQLEIRILVSRHKPKYAVQRGDGLSAPDCRTIRSRNGPALPDTLHAGGLVDGPPRRDRASTHPAGMDAGSARRSGTDRPEDPSRLARRPTPSNARHRRYCGASD
jgi:hypothetical protein